MHRAMALLLSGYLYAFGLTLSSAAQSPQTQGGSGVLIEESRAPIDSLFEAWRALDTRLYIAQWSPDAAKIDAKSGTRQGTAQLLADRTRLFGQIAHVEVDYTPTLLSASSNEATYRVAYSLRIRFRNGRTTLDTACESYRVQNRGGTWLIVENVDYISCDLGPRDLGRSSPTMAGQSCDDLWKARNSIYAQYGFCFKQARSIAVFGRGCFPPYGELPPSAQEEVDRILAAESAQRCPR